MTNNKKTILIIEDDANLLYSLQAKFNIAGYKTVTDPGTSLAAIEDKLKAYRPDLIILDLILPKTEGFEILRKIKSDQKYSAVPVYIFTNLSDADSKTRGVNLGADHYFIKRDFTIDDFVAKIKKILDNQAKAKR